MQDAGPGNWQPPAQQPAEYVRTLAFAGVGKRVVAYIIDQVIVGVINFLVQIALAAAGLYRAGANGSVNYTGLLLALVIGLIVSAAYFIYQWTSMRATLGMRLFSMQIGTEGSGATITNEQAAIRWAALVLPGSLATILYPAGTVVVSLVELIVLIYYIALLVTTAQSPTKQGLHDRWAHTEIVEAA